MKSDSVGNADERSVTGLVLHFRTPEDTLRCLESMREQGVVTAVVVDNSEDAGRSMKQMGDGLRRLADQGLAIKVLSLAHNVGFANGVSAGFRRILREGNDGPVLLMNSDARLEEGALHAMIKALAATPLVTPKVKQNHDSKPVSLIGFYQPALGLITRKYIPGAVAHPSGCCLLINFSLVNERFFDREFFFYGEDAMLGFDLRRRGIKFGECPEAFVVHKGSVSAKNGSMFYEYHMARAHWLIGRKASNNNWQAAAYLGLRCITLPLRALVRSARFRNLVAWRALFLASWDFFQGKARTLTPPNR